MSTDPDEVAAYEEAIQLGRAEERAALAAHLTAEKDYGHDPDYEQCLVDTLTWLEAQ